MNTRISLAEIAARLSTAGYLPNGTKVGTSYDRDYLSSYGKVFPSVWVGAQRLSALDDGMAYTQQHRQHVRVEIGFRIIVQRYINGEANGAAEVRLNALCDAVADKLKDWAPTGADTPLVWSSQQDGPPAESVMVVDCFFSTTLTYARVS